MSTISSGTSLEQNNEGKRNRRLFLAWLFWEALRELDMRKEIWVILCRNRRKDNHANSQSAQCNYIKLYELRIIMLLDEIRNNNDNNGNFICVFECTIVNLATYRQFTNAA